MKKPAGRISRKAGGIARRIDLSTKEDMSIAVMNLLSTEEHLAFTAMKTGRTEYLAVLGPVRELRKSLLRELVANTEGEMWCISKHLLSICMRLMETGVKYLKSDQKRAKAMFDSAFDAYSLFWFLQKMGPAHKGGREDDAQKPGKRLV